MNKGRAAGRGVVEVAEKFTTMSIGGARKELHPPPPMKAGGWRGGPGDSFTRRSQEAVQPARSYTRKVAGWRKAYYWSSFYWSLLCYLLMWNDFIEVLCYICVSAGWVLHPVSGYYTVWYGSGLTKHTAGVAIGVWGRDHAHCCIAYDAVMLMFNVRVIPINGWCFYLYWNALSAVVCFIYRFLIGQVLSVDCELWWNDTNDRKLKVTAVQHWQDDNVHSQKQGCLGNSLNNVFENLKWGIETFSGTRDLHCDGWVHFDLACRSYAWLGGVGWRLG